MTNTALIHSMVGSSMSRTLESQNRWNNWETPPLLDRQGHFLFSFSLFLSFFLPSCILLTLIFMAFLRFALKKKLKKEGSVTLVVPRIGKFSPVSYLSLQSHRLTVRSCVISISWVHHPPLMRRREKRSKELQDVRIHSRPTWGINCSPELRAIPESTSSLSSVQ